MTNKQFENTNNIDMVAEINKAGETLAQAHGQDLESMYNNIQSDLNSDNPIKQQAGVRAAAAFTAQLTQLILRQTLDIIGESEKENKIVHKFRKLTMPEGNYYNFILNINTGVDRYQDTPFTPQQHTDPQSETHTLAFYKPDGHTPDDNSHMFHKMLTLRAHEWTQYFKTNTLSAFLGNIRDQIVESINMMKLAKVQKFLKELPIAKQITGKASNEDAYDSLNELIDWIETVQFNDSDFCINKTGFQSKNIKPAKKSDLLVLINKKTLNLIRTGLKARLINPEAFSLTQVVDADNIIEFHKMINDTANTSTVITTSNDSVVDANTVIVIDRNALVLIDKLFFSGEQMYNANMAIQLDVHYWFMIGIIPWYKGFKFTDTKLSVIPQ